MHHPRLRIVAATLAALPIPLIGGAVAAPLAAAQGQQSGGSLTVDVAETGSRFVPDEHFVDADGVPTRGNYFITDGYLYEPGTLTCIDGVCDGVVYDDAVSWLMFGCATRCHANVTQCHACWSPECQRGRDVADNHPCAIPMRCQ